MEDKPNCPYCLINGKDATNVVFLRDREKWKCCNCGVHFFTMEILE